MKYKIDEFDVNETIIDEEVGRQRNYETAKTFPVELQEELVSVLSRFDKDGICYSISKDGVYVGEITFRKANPRQPAIGIELEKPFQRQGIGYRLITALMERYKKQNKVDFFVYEALNKNVGSNALAKKLGAVLVKEKTILKEINLAWLTYHIEP